MKYERITTIIVAVFLGVLFIDQTVHAQGLIQVTGKCTQGNEAVIELIIPDELGVDGVDFYRADTVDGQYRYLGTQELDNWDYDEDDYYEESEYIYKDKAAFPAYQYYYYRIMPYQSDRLGYYDENGNYVEPTSKTYLETLEVSIYVYGVGPVVKSGKRSGKNAAKLTWTQVADADGYMIYCTSNLDKKGHITYNDIWNEQKYTLVKKTNNNSTLSATFKKLEHGVTYTYRIYSYKNVDGAVVQSIPSDPKMIPMDYYAYSGEDYDQKVKRAFGSKKKMNKNFSTEAKARKQMKTIKIKVWDFANGKSGKKVTKTKYLTVNKNLAPTIQHIFKEIYNSKEKQVIHDIGCYCYREGEHMYGLAIDVNANENYMIDGKKILAGRFWKPKKNPYSIPNKSEFVEIMRRYGFRRGAWGARKDYMHFSYFGT